MNFGFNCENYSQNLNNQQIQQILNIQNVFSPILQQSPQLSYCQIQSLLLQQLIQLENSQFGYNPQSQNLLSNCNISATIPLIHTESPPEYPQFPLFPRTYNAQFDQLKQLQDPKSKYNLGSKKDKEGGGNLNYSNTSYSFKGIVTEQQQQYKETITQQAILNPKLVGFQRVAKKSPILNDMPIDPNTSSYLIERNENHTNIANSFQKTEEFMGQVQHESIQNSYSSQQGLKSLDFLQIMAQKVGEQDTNSSHQETACESLGINPSTYMNSPKNDLPDNMSTSSMQQSSVLQGGEPGWITLLKESNFEKLKNISDSSVFKQMASLIFLNQQQNNSTLPFPSNQAGQFCNLTSPFNQNINNDLINKLSNPEKEISILNQESIQESSSYPPTTSSSSSSASSASSASSTTNYLSQSNSYLTLENKKELSLSKDSCSNILTKSATRFAYGQRIRRKGRRKKKANLNACYYHLKVDKDNEPSGKNKKRKDEHELILEGINKYLGSLNLKVNFKDKDNYALIFNKKPQDSSQSEKEVESNSEQSINKREQFTKDPTSSYSQGFLLPTNISSKEDTIIEEQMEVLMNQTSSYESHDEDKMIENENDELIARDLIKVKKRRGLNETVSLQINQLELQRNNPVKQIQIESQNSNSKPNEKGKTSCTNKNNECDGQIESTNLSNVQDIFMNARRNKKREQKIQQSIEQNSQLSTKFHNLTRLLMYKIIKIFKDESNLRQNYNMNAELSSHLKRIASKIKQHSKECCKSQIKTNFYTHSHYNALFLVLNDDNIKTISQNQKDVDAHKFIYGLDLRNTNGIDVTFANIIKTVAYQIVNANLSDNIINQSFDSTLQQTACNQSDTQHFHNHISNLRSLYFQRAFQGITKMNNGFIVSRF